MNIKEIAEKFIKAWQEALLIGEVNTFKGLFDRDFIYHAPPGPDLNLTAYMQHVIDMRTNSKVIQVDVKYLTGEGNLFAVEFKGRFNFTSNMPGSLSTAGKEVTSHYLCLLQTKNQKIIEGWSNGTIIVSS